MSLKTFKSYTKSTRGTVLVDRKKLWKGKSLKSLTIGKNSTGGRNNFGRITSRSRGAGHKHKYRKVDFHRKKDNFFNDFPFHNFFLSTKTVPLVDLV